MKYTVPIFVFIFIFNYSQAQDYKKYLPLEYSEIDSLMLISYKKGAYKQASLYMEAAQEKARVDYGEQDSSFANYTADLGFFYSKMGKYDKALPLYLQVLDIRAAVLGVNHRDYASALNSLAFLYSSMGKYEEALTIFIQAKDIIENQLGLDHPDLAVALNNLAILHYRTKNYDKALPIFIQAKNIREKAYGKEHTLVASSLNNIAALYKETKKYKKALPLLIQAKDIREKTVGKEHPSYSIATNNLANLYEEMGRYDKALPLLIKTKNLREKTLGKEHPKFATTLNNLASFYKNRGENEKALPLYIQAKEIRIKVLGKEHPRSIVMLYNLADLYRKLKRYDEAWSMLNQAIQITTHLDLQPTISKAWADSISNATFASNAHFDELISTLSYVYPMLSVDPKVQNTLAKQVVVTDLVIKLLTRFRSNISNEKDKLRLLSKSSDWLKKSLGILNPEKDAVKAFELSDQNKSVLLLHATRSAPAYYLGELPDSLIKKDLANLKKQSKLKAKLLEKRNSESKRKLRTQLINVEQDIEDLRSLIKKDYPKYYAFKYQEISANSDIIQKELPPKTALLEFVIGDSIVHIFYLDKHQVEWKKISLDKNILDKKITKFHRILSNYQLIVNDESKAYREYTNQAYWFYQNLLRPVLADKQGLENLLIITDGKLGHLPFEVFLVEQPSQKILPYDQLHYLVKDYNISYNYSASLWNENMTSVRKQNNGQIFALAANYDTKLDSQKQNLRLSSEIILRGTLSHLPDAKKEVETLENEFQGYFAFNEFATEAVIKEIAPNYAIMHFATHGILDKNNPVLSSIVLTENGDSLENNFWQAHEISKLQINADLVVLSACETGFGKFEKGNGIASLARAFMYAGASSLVVSLWQVNDFATSAIMKNFYNNLADGLPKNVALRQAKLQYIESSSGYASHPAFWSPFIQIGNTDVVDITRKGSFSNWGIAVLIGLAISVFTLIFWKRKR